MSDEQPNEQTLNFRAAALLRSLADECERNLPERFRGCFIVIPPEGEPKDLMLLSAATTAAMFWSNVKVMAEIAMSEAAEAERSQGGAYARR